jgi:hypothetical protein
MFEDLNKNILYFRDTFTSCEDNSKEEWASFYLNKLYERSDTRSWKRFTYIGI